MPRKKARQGKQEQRDLATFCHDPLHHDLQFYDHRLEMKEGLDCSQVLKLNGIQSFTSQ
jgi:hypothetical protein